MIAATSSYPLFHSLAAATGENLLCHDQGREAISKSINADSRLWTSSIVRPNDVESAVDKRYGQGMECRMA